MKIPVHILPLWNIKDYHTLNYNKAYHRDIELNKRFITAGHHRDSMIINHYFEPNPMPDSIEYIKNQFSGIENIAVAVNLFTPGTYLPMHNDLYGRYRNLHGQDRKVFRAIIMLEDSYPGQILQIEDQAHASWTAGAVFYWYDDVMHAFYNMSLQNRYAIQLTGMVND